MADIEDHSSPEASKDGNNRHSGDDGDEYEQSPDDYLSAEFSEAFSTREIFKSRDDAMKWIRKVGKQHNIVVVITRSVKKSAGQNAKAWIACERHGKLRPKRGRDLPTKVVKPRKSSSKRCECPFRMKCYEVTSNAWVLKVTCGIHNHPIAQQRVRNTFDSRLTTKEYELTKEFTASHMKPKNILDRLKQIDPLNASTLRMVYNARQKAKKEGFERKTIVQQFMHQVDYNKYFERDRVLDDGVVSEMFFAHPESLNLLRSFPYVLIMDAACKTNKFNMLFLEIVGFTSMWKNFPVAGVFMTDKKADTYRWILKQLKEMLRLVGKMPSIIVTDTDIAWVNALRDELPATNHLFCRRSIYKDIEAKCFNDSISKEEVNKLEWRCKTIFEAKTEEEYSAMLTVLEQEWSHLPSLIQYLHQMWLIPHKYKIVSVWTDKITHFGAHIATRVESANSSMKKFLASNPGGLDTVFSHVHSQFESLIVELKASFEHSRTHVRHEVANVSCFRLLQMAVSEKALDLLMEEHKLLQKGVLGKCECKLQVTHGLPCAHQITVYVRERRLIELDVIHPMWKTLEFQEVDQEAKKLLVIRRHEDVTMEEFYARFPHMTVEERMKATRFMYNMLHPESVSMDGPLQQQLE